MVGPAPDAPTGDAATIAAARARLAMMVQVAPEIVETLCAVAMALGIASMRAPILALRAAVAITALAGRAEVTAEDAASAGWRWHRARRCCRRRWRHRTRPDPTPQTSATQSDPPVTEPPVTRN